ncbi:15041_t:CDS:1, partial [Gigaspora rosea]
YIRDQFEVLYQDEPVEINAIEALTSDLPSVSLQQNEALIKEISLQEVINTIDKLPNYKAPSSNRITYEFYKAYHEEVSPILREVFNKALGLGIIPDLWRKSVITLLSKKNETLKNIGNWRPISLVNADAKIFMKIIADRLNHICNDIIDDYQAGFVKDRSIVDAALDILSTMRSQENQSNTAWLLFLDQKNPLTE